jgi:hypothetical protein
MKRPILLLGILLAHCSSESTGVLEQPVGPSEQKTSAAPIRVDEDLPRFAGHWRKRTPAEISARILTVGELVSGGAALSADQARAAVDASSDKRHDSSRPFTQNPGIVVKYDRPADDLRISNSELRDETEGPDVGEVQARAVLAATMGQLVAKGLIDAGRWPLERARFSRTLFGVAPSTEVAKEQVVEYTFTILRQINGLEFANSGVSISVHRSGKVSSIRIGGAEFDSAVSAGKELPVGALNAVKRRFDDTTLRAKFTKEWPNAQIQWDKTMYVRADTQDGTIEPRYVVSYSIVSNIEGRSVNSRRMMKGYSLETDGDVVLLSDPPKPDIVSAQPRPPATAAPVPAVH